MRPPARREAPSLFGEIALPCSESAPSVRRGSLPCSKKRTIYSEWFTPLFGEAHHLFGVVHSPVRRSAPSVRRERLSQTQCRNGCEIKKKCELVAAKRIENLIYTRAVLRCNAPANNSSAIASPASNSSTIEPRPETASRWRSATAPRPAASCQQQLRYGALASRSYASAVLQ